MSIRSAILSRVIERYLSSERLERQRARAEKARRASGRPHVVHYFHQADDPYAHLMAQVLPHLARRFDVTIEPHLVKPPADWAAPEREQLVAYSRRDAALLALRAGLSFMDHGRQPDPSRVRLAEGQCAAAIREGTFVDLAESIGTALWLDQAPPSALPAPAGTGETERAKSAGDAQREALGHYLGATLFYEGEWYWGIDRLHYLESRLDALGARKTGEAGVPLFAPPVSPAPDARPASAGTAEQTGAALHWYLSFRSPYTAIVADRAEALAKAYGVPLRLRFVLPMVMRNLPVPPVKSTYIIQDTAREARRLGVSFGRVCDPVGRPTERGYAVLPFAIAEGRGLDYARAFLKAVWSQGVDAGTDSGLKRIVTDAGLDWSQARRHLTCDDWRGEAEANRREMVDLGLWGVPSFRFGDTAVWGQDRLWVIESAIRRNAMPTDAAKP
ncbi:MAG: DsbA family protein [Alphaproteobacteria bacterium]